MYKEAVRAAFLLALMIVFQSLRLFLPLPVLVSMFLVGSAINACLLLAVEFSTMRAAIIIACLAPVIAFMQQALPLPIFILPVAFTNVCYLVSYKIFCERNKILAIVFAAVIRMLTLYFSSYFIFLIMELPEMIESTLKLVMSWPQFVAGVLGGILFLCIYKRCKS